MARTRTKLLAVRMSSTMLRELDGFGQRLQTEVPYLPIRRTDIVRVLMTRALEHLDGFQLEPLPNGEPHVHLVSTRVPAELLDKIDELTASYGSAVSRSDVVRALLARALAAGAR